MQSYHCTDHELASSEADLVLVVPIPTALQRNKSMNVKDTKADKVHQEKEPESPDLSDDVPPTYKETAQASSSNGEVEHLRAELRDVMDKNARWQVYNSQREDYVRGLLEKHNYVAHRLQHADKYIEVLRSNPDKLHEEQRRHFDALLVQVRQQLQQSRDETTKLRTELEITKTNCEKEVDASKKEVEHWRGMYEEQREIISRLHSECESERRRSTSSLLENKEKKRQIRLLQTQVETYTKNFQSEREEKEDLRLEVKQLRKEIRRSRDRSAKLQMSHHEERRSEKDDFTHNDSVKIIDHYKRPHVSTHKPHMPHSRGSDSAKHTGVENRLRGLCLDDEKENVTVRRKRRSHDKEPMSTQNFVLEEDEDFDSHLQCPTCGKLYHVDDHHLLLSHIDRCN